jgi:hypothetical protein
VKIDGMQQVDSGFHVDEPAQRSRVPLKTWELVLFSFGVLIAAVLVLSTALGYAMYWFKELSGDCDGVLLCGLDAMIGGMTLGAVAAPFVTYVVIRRWRRRPPRRMVAWVVVVVLPIVVVFAAAKIDGFLI